METARWNGLTARGNGGYPCKMFSANFREGDVAVKQNSASGGNCSALPTHMHRTTKF
jgi:hypothetical protein